MLKKYNVKYWLDAGSAIGVLRNGGIIPWDDDVDIALYNKDINRITTEDDEYKLVEFAATDLGNIYVGSKTRISIICSTFMLIIFHEYSLSSWNCTERCMPRQTFGGVIMDRFIL